METVEGQKYRDAWEIPSRGWAGRGSKVMVDVREDLSLTPALLTHRRKPGMVAQSCQPAAEKVERSSFLGFPL